MAHCLFLGSCNLFSFMYAHICLTTSARVAFSTPIIASKSSETCNSFKNPVGFPCFPRFFLGAPESSEEKDASSESESFFLRRLAFPPLLRFLPHSSPEDEPSSSSEKLSKPRLCLFLADPRTPRPPPPALPFLGLGLYSSSLGS